MKKKTIIRISVALLCALFISTVLLFTACSSPKYEWKLSDLGDGVDFHTEKQAAYMASEDYDTLAFVSGAEESKPNAVTFIWEATPVKEGAVVTGYDLEISRDNKFSEDTTWTFTTTETSYDVYNLYIATDYYWRVTAVHEDGKKSTSPTHTFSTGEIGFRNINVDGVTNVRDLGGWKTEDGGRVKQGMIYRCGRLNIGNADGVHPEVYTENITAEGKKVMREQLGIKSEIDLRRVDNDEVGHLADGDVGPLGEKVDYKQIPMNWEIGTENERNNLVSANKAKIQEFFTYMADKSHYPMIFHCNIGTDRTGALAYLINGLLGVTEEGLHRDYMLSNLGNISSSRKISKITSTYGAMLEKRSGSTLREKIEDYLINEIGVTQGQIDTIKDLMLED